MIRMYISDDKKIILAPESSPKLKELMAEYALVGIFMDLFTIEELADGLSSLGEVIIYE